MANYNAPSATMRASSEPMALVINPAASASTVEQPKAAPKKRNRSNFTVAKQKTIALYNQVKWLEGSIKDNTVSGEVSSKQYLGIDEINTLFKKCLLHVISEMPDYNEDAFKKDMAINMSYLLNDKRFNRTCEQAEWSLFKTAQLLTWTSAADFQKIRNEGIGRVMGFNVQGHVAYSYGELKNFLRALGFTETDFDGDPYVHGWEDRKKQKQESSDSDAA